MAERRTTERAESEFKIAFSFMDRTKDRSGIQAQYDLYMAMGLMSLSEAIREVYDKLEQIDRKLSIRP